MSSISSLLTQTSKGIKVEKGPDWPACSSLKGVPVPFGDLVVQMGFLTVHGSPFDIMVGTSTLEDLMEKFYLGQQIVCLCMKDSIIEIPPEPDFGKLRNHFS